MRTTRNSSAPYPGPPFSPEKSVNYDPANDRMLVTTREKRLCQTLRDFPYEHHLRYTEQASHALQHFLFRSLVAENEDYLVGLFGGRVPRRGEEWSLSKAQGMTEDMEYTEAARGRPCGHIYKSGDSIFRCKTCTDDDTAVLCTRCFEASDHTGHIVTQSISLGNSGCCDCGDDEAWKIPVRCAIHTTNASTAAVSRAQTPALPDELVECIKMTIGRAMDYLIDVISCSPENLRLRKTEESIRENEKKSRLGSLWYKDREEVNPEYALILWNDEKHTVIEVEDQVARACKKRRTFGRQKANETNDYGRSVVEYSMDIQRLLKIAEIIEQIKITVTIRSSRDTFREQMCGTIIQWLNDIAGCSVGQDHEILRQTICQELLKTWRQGSEASNKYIGKDGLDDHDLDDQARDSNVEILAQAIRRQNMLRHLTARQARDESDTDSPSNDNEEEDGDDDAESQLNENPVGADQMDLDIMTATNTEGDEEMRTPNDMEDGAEVSEATFAGYPPPPPPPPAPPPQHHARMHSIGSEINEPFANISFAPLAPKKNIDIPTTPGIQRRKGKSHPPAYWLQQPQQCASKGSLPLHEDLRQWIRLDWLLLYDLRLWKKVRIDLRDLYITTLISTPHTKRIFGLRFAGLYSILGQLYLIADREPDHSIINLSVQTFTTPSVTQEVIERGNFLTTLFSMLYTFLTQRTVQQPWQVSVDDSMASENNSVSNRRMYHFFSDLKHMFGADYVRRELRTQERYQLQFLDLIRLPQGICPNVRAVGEHVEYENDIWISAQILTKEINKLCRQFAETFYFHGGANGEDLARVLRTVAKATVVNSMGGERMRFDQAEIKFETRFKTLAPFHFERSIDSSVHHSVVDFVVEREAISFHHALHYTLSWLIDGGKGMPLERLRNLLTFTLSELRQPPPYKVLVSEQSPEDYLMATFDFPLRVCAWLAQMKASMWVRNGLSLRHQMNTYRGVAHRDLAHHRDIFLLQTAMVVCNPSRVLASMVERFGMDDWMRGNYIIRNQFEPGQQLDVAEDFIHLLIVMLCDRTSLLPVQNPDSARAAAIRRDIAHILCFKPLSFSDLDTRFADKTTDLEDFQDILDEMTNFRPPEGLSDTGSFELKGEYLDEVDPYAAHYSKNQRDEAENAYRNWMSRRYGKPAAEIVYEPKLLPIESGVFTGLAHFTKTPLFAQIIFYSLALVSNTHRFPDIPSTRIEAYLHVVLHLVLAAVLEDTSDEDTDTTHGEPSFAKHVLHSDSELGITIFHLLVKMLENLEMKSCHPKVRLILHRLRRRRPEGYSNAISRVLGDSAGLPADRLGFESPMTPADDDQETKQRQARQLKKKQALDRQAKVMAQFQQQQQNFLNNQDITEWEDEDESLVSSNVEDQTKVWKYPRGNCIMCQEETNETRLYGTFGLMTNSTVFRQTDVRDVDFVTEVLSTPDNLDSSAEDIRPFGIASSNRKQVLKRGPDGHEFAVEHQGLAKGFPPFFATRGPVSTGCGHLMHYSCFETYCSATHRRQNHQIARQHAERMDLKEFVCPLCKALGNSFLPIIWKGKEEAYPGVLQTDTAFEQWLSSGVGLTISRFFKTQEGRANDDRLRELFSSYTSKAMISPLANKLSSHAQTPLTSPISPQSATRALFSGMQGLWSSNSETIASPGSLASGESTLVNELMAVYSRLRNTVSANKLPSRFEYPNDGPLHDFANTDTLARIFGQSIASAEIAQRGTQSEHGLTLVDRMPAAVLTHLRILSETVSSYVAIGGLQPSGSMAAVSEFSDNTKLHLMQLFIGHPHMVHNVDEAMRMGLPPALSQDSFVLLAECSFTMAPALNMEIHHILQLCYVLEVVKVALYLTTAPDIFEACYRISPSVVDCVPTMPLPTLRDFLLQLSTFSSPHWPVMSYHKQSGREVVAETRSPEQHALLYRAISRYALAFLRKAAVLLNVRYGVNFPEHGLADLDDSELIRLTKLLRLPSLPKIFASVGQSGSSTDGNTINSVIAGWIQHWQLDAEHQRAFEQHLSLDQCHAILSQSAYNTLRPGHPVIFELIGLPKHFDTLTYEVTRRRCPTKGSKLEDASLCLFCGEFFCGQALCCSKHGKGGCFQHMQKCGIDVGLFLNIRKCTVLYLYNRNGSWNLAPYLDKYGEPDPGLRRGRQLSLNQKRYDRLFRDVWLQQGIPTTIARKLEAEINNGGWETL
ncbi:MAG: hypothetical protein Q9217_003356 [Psora testacea]